MVVANDGVGVNEVEGLPLVELLQLFWLLVTKSLPLMLKLWLLLLLILLLLLLLLLADEAGELINDNIGVVVVVG